MGPPSIETVHGMRVVGMRRAMSFAAMPVRELWKGFRLRVGEIGDRVSEDFVSMRVFDPPLRGAPGVDARFEQWAAVAVGEGSEVPPGMEAHTLAGGTYAVFTYRGRASDFGAAARFIFGEWLPGSDFELDDREHFEILGPTYRPDDPNATEQVWIPVRRRGPG